MDKFNRVTYIDILKCFGIFFLLFEHTGNWCSLEGYYTLIKVWICSFHMPLFFAAYGMIFFDRNKMHIPLGWI